jgi:hypothetical protein
LVRATSSNLLNCTGRQMKATMVGSSSQNEGSLTFPVAMVAEYRMGSVYVVKPAANRLLGWACIKLKGVLCSHRWRRRWTLFHTQMNAMHQERGCGIDWTSRDSWYLNVEAAELETLLPWGGHAGWRANHFGRWPKKDSSTIWDWLRRSSADSSVFATTAVLRTGAIV